jgi:hypothetical protein
VQRLDMSHHSSASRRAVQLFSPAKALRKAENRYTSRL